MESLKSIDFPPFYGKNDWIIDPKKIISRPVHITLETIPEEEEEDVKEVIKVEQKSREKRVRFASYADVHMRCPIVDTRIRYPSKMIEELKQENALLNDELLIAEKKIEQLELKLKKTKQELYYARTINDTLPLWILVLLLVGLVISYKYAKLNL